MDISNQYSRNEYNLEIDQKLEMYYHIPDERWEIFGAKDFETYLKQYVVTSEFHSFVPNDIVEAYSTAEHIMALAYYHYPMYDEAFSKVLKLIELAVKLKCNELNITYSRNAKLNTLINELVKQLPIIKISERLHAAREIRNHSMHPSQNSYAGGILRGSMIALVNLLNEIFLPPAFFKDSKEEVERIQELLIPFEKGTYVLEWDNKRFLIYKAKCFEAIRHKDMWNYFLVCYPVIKDVKQEIEDHKISGVLKFSLTDLIVKENTINATNKDGQSIRISINDNPTNITAIENYIEELSKYSYETMRLYGVIIEDSIDRAISEFNYKHYKLIEHDKPKQN